jgi:hypothetical protein
MTSPFPPPKEKFTGEDAAAKYKWDDCMQQALLDPWGKINDGKHT